MVTTSTTAEIMKAPMIIVQAMFSALLLLSSVVALCQRQEKRFVGFWRRVWYLVERGQVGLRWVAEGLGFGWCRA